MSSSDVRLRSTFARSAAERILESFPGVKGSIDLELLDQAGCHSARDERAITEAVRGWRLQDRC
jgi:hypothetical protein